jgi:hypothetical protein
VKRPFASGWFLAIAALFAALAYRTGTDTNYDLRNYHAYIAHALLNGRFWTDIAPAQLQTFFAPTSDIAFGALRDWLNDEPRLLNVVLSLLHTVAVFLAFLLILRLLPQDLPGRAPLAFAAALFGALGAAGYPTLASSLSDMVPASCVLGGLLLLTKEPSQDHRAVIKAGALFGIAAGLKITMAPYCIGAVAALLLAPEVSAARRFRAFVAFSAAGASMAALVGGPWWLTTYLAYGNPILPAMNQWFHSPYVAPLPFTDERFKPTTWAEIIAYPFFWSETKRSIVSELPVRDPRFAMVYVAVVIVLLRSAASRLHHRLSPDRTATILVAFSIVSFAVWEALFSILRYLAALELLVGAMILLAARPLLADARLRTPATAGLVLLFIAGQAATVYPDWGRINAQPVAVNMPTLPGNSMVVLLDPSPMAYLATYVPSDVRFIGANNNLIQPGRGARLARQAETSIRTHEGPLFGLEDPVASPGIADTTLAFYRLRRDACSQIESNLDANAIRLCRLVPLDR